MRGFLGCHSERSEESLTNVRSAYAGDPSLITQDDRKSKGFTLAEILVVMTIVGIVGVILVLIFTNTLRGSNKSQILAVIKQNGQSVLDSMDKTIRNADDIACVSTDSNTLVVVKDGAYTRYRLFPGTKTGASANNGSIQQDFPVQPQPVQPPPSPDKSDINVFLRAICTDPLGTDTIPPNSYQTLTDTNPQTGVLVQNLASFGLFQINSQAGSNDSVTVKFQLSPAVGIPAAIVSQIDPVTFQTTIELRNN